MQSPRTTPSLQPRPSSSVVGFPILHAKHRPGDSPPLCHPAMSRNVTSRSSSARTRSWTCPTTGPGTGPSPPSWGGRRRRRHHQRREGTGGYEHVPPDQGRPPKSGGTVGACVDSTGYADVAVAFCSHRNPSVVESVEYMASHYLALNEVPGEVCKSYCRCTGARRLSAHSRQRLLQHALMVGKPGEGTPALCCLRGWERRIPPTELLLRRKVWSSDSQGLCDLHSISIHRAAPSSFNYRRVVRLIDLTFLSVKPWRYCCTKLP